jgi:hypothetical protein
MSQHDADPTIDEIRSIRHQISARFDHDPNRLVEHYMKLQEAYKDRLLTSPASEQKDDNTA